MDLKQGVREAKVTRKKTAFATIVLIKRASNDNDTNNNINIMIIIVIIVLLLNIILKMIMITKLIIKIT